MLVVVIVDYRGEQKTSFETHLFPFWERTKNVLRVDTRHKWFQHWFSNGNEKNFCCVSNCSCLSQSAVIVDAKVSDQQRRLVEISSVVIKVVFAMCSLGFALLLSCWVHFKARSLSLSDNDFVLFGTCNQVQLSIYVSSVFPQSGFRLFVFRRTEVVFIAMLHTLMVQKPLFGNSPVRWPFKYDATHAHFEQIQLE